MTAIYSAHINAEQGAIHPDPIPGLKNWTVSKEGQTEVYKITHNLNKVLHVVATPMSTDTIVSISANTSTYFTIFVLSATNQAPKSSDFMFIAVTNTAPVV